MTLSNKSTMEGHAESTAESIGAELDIVELGTAVTDSAKWEAAMCDLCEAGYGLIITGGSLMQDTIQTVALIYPEMSFICYDVALDFDAVEMDNVYSMDFYQNEASYMASIIWIIFYGYGGRAYMMV